MASPKADKPKEPTEWERFEEFSKRLLAVPADEVKKKQAEYEAEKQRRCPNGTQQ